MYTYRIYRVLIVTPVNGSRSVVESSGSSGVSRTYWSRLSSCTLGLAVTLGRPYGKHTCYTVSRWKRRCRENYFRGKVQSPFALTRSNPILSTFDVRVSTLKRDFYFFPEYRTSRNMPRYKFSRRLIAIIVNNRIQSEWVYAPATYFFFFTSCTRDFFSKFCYLSKCALMLHVRGEF